MSENIIAFLGSNVKHLVLDEADMMLDMGFIDDVEYIIKKSGRDKQVMLFSATIPPRISGLSDRYMHNPQFIEISHDQELTVESISHSYSISERSHKLRTLFAYIETFKPRKAIIFSDTKRNADYLYRALIRQVTSAAETERSLLFIPSISNNLSIIFIE